MAAKPAALWTDDLYWAVDPRVRVVGFQRSAPSHRYTPARTLIEDFDLWYITGGRGAVRIDGRWTDFSAGDLVTMKPGQHYQDERADAADPHVQYYVHVLPFGSDPRGFGGALASRWPKKMSVAHQPRMAPLFAELFETFTTRPDGHQLRLKSIMLQVLEIVFAALRQSTDGRPPPAYAKLVKAREYLVANNRCDLTLGDVAEHADLSESYLSTLFNRYFGCSPLRYHARLRMRQARLLLAQGQSVTRVAEKVGFHSLHYFSRTFRQHTGQSPSEFAALCCRK